MTMVVHDDALVRFPPSWRMSGRIILTTEPRLHVPWLASL